ncbi:hypothetical protein Nm8I071_23510 [Nonomuraea sp. TT08I-71]|nr:hypothetical protein Nm8I071_23510 [Nonomuraea sp. TT08I-71]
MHGWLTATVRDRMQRLRVGGILALQASVAAALSWLAAHELLNRPDPVFAPISAVATLAASVGQRARRTVELVVGVALGVLVADALLYVIGTGPWQLGTVVGLSILAAIILGGSAAVVLQAAATAVLVATLSPTERNLEIPRFVDAFVGGGVALLVTSVLLPLNPLRLINRAARPALDMLAEQLRITAEGLRDRNAGGVRQAMDRLRRNKEELQALIDAVQGAKEATTLSPVSWRHRRGILQHYAKAAEPIDRAMRNSGTLIRRAVTVIEDREPIPNEMVDAVAGLAEAVQALREEFAGGKVPSTARERLFRAIHSAGSAYNRGVGFSGSVVIAQVRTTASDLFLASGIPQDDANRMVRRAFRS